MKGLAHLFPLHVLELRLTSFGRCTETDIFGMCTDIRYVYTCLCLIFGLYYFVYILASSYYEDLDDDSNNTTRFLLLLLLNQQVHLVSIQQTIQRNRHLSIEITFNHLPQVPQIVRLFHQLNLHLPHHHCQLLSAIIVSGQEARQRLLITRCKHSTSKAHCEKGSPDSYSFIFLHRRLSPRGDYWSC